MDIYFTCPPPRGLRENESRWFKRKMTRGRRKREKGENGKKGRKQENFSTQKCNIKVGSNPAPYRPVLRIQSTFTWVRIQTISKFSKI